MARNGQAVGLPLWFMLCSCDDGEKHEQIVLKITFKIIFERIKDVIPSALVTDKSDVEYNAIYNVLANDPCS